MQQISISLKQALKELEINNNKFLNLFNSLTVDPEITNFKKQVFAQSTQTNEIQHDQIEDNKFTFHEFDKFKTIENMITDIQTKISDLEKNQIVFSDKKLQVKNQNDKIQLLQKEIEIRQLQKKSQQAFQVEKNKRKIASLKRKIKQQIIANNQQKEYNEKLRNLDIAANQFIQEDEVKQ